MSKRARSPVLGYNHNLRYGGRVFHVQTEDSGTGYARLYTHLFFEGTILSSKKEEYQAEVAEDSVRALMQKLHKEMIRELTRGEHDARIAAFFTARGEPAMLAPTAAAAVAAAGQAAAPAIVEAASPVEVVNAVAPAPAVAKAPPVIVVGPAATRTPSPIVKPNVTPKPVVIVQPTTLKRSPVAVSSAADGVVVRRNVVIDVGAGQPPVQGAAAAAGPAPAARPKASPPVAREASGFVAGTRIRAAAEAPPQQPLASSREVRMPWESSATRRQAQPGAPTAMMPVVEQTAPLSSGKLRMPWDAPGAGAPAVLSDKSLDEVILEYLADDQDSGG